MTYVDATVAPLRKTGQIKIHGPAAFEGMRKAGRLAAECLDMLAGEIGPGVTTEHIDQLVYEFGMDHHAAAGDFDVSRLPEIDLHVGQSRGLPRHSLAKSRCAKAISSMST